ncbi:MAG: hypothetical protein K9L85_03700 [Candidatus Peribacteraceae bacterium]|nr:hypothetical protein [Candidatus Peribacteraceae bacterium]
MKSEILFTLLAGVLLASGCGLTTSTVSIPAGWSTQTDSGFSFRYPVDFGSEFITTVDWPPKITFQNGNFSCSGETHSIDGNDFCLNKTAEGAAGSVYSTYRYSREYNTQILTLDFTIREPQCPNYPEPKISQCTADQANLNLDSIVGTIVASINFTK